MEAQIADQPWIEVDRLIAVGDPAALAEFFAALPPGEAQRVLDRLPEATRVRVVSLLEPAQAADLVDRLPEPQAAALVEHLEPSRAAAIVQELPSDEQADLLNDLSDADAEAILAVMEPEQAEEARVLARYPADVAGGLMITEYVAYPEHATVQDVVEDLRANADRYRDYDVQYAYVTKGGDELVGVLRLRDLLLARRAETIRGIMFASPLSIIDTMPLDEVHDVFDRVAFYGIPVVDSRRRLVGVVRRAAVEKALGARNEGDYLKSLGIVGGEELRSMPLLTRSRRRLAWLSINIVLNLIAASVIAMYQETLAAVLALAVFLPIISDMSGCSGNQAVAVSMRELTLGLIRPVEMLRVWLKEVSVGLLNGLALGALLALAAWIWKGNVFLGVVVGGAMAVNTMVAVSIGGVVPLLLRRFGMDPALASGPILTTITDMCGFFLLLSMASATLPLLTH